MKSSGLVLKERAYTSPVTPPDTFEDESRFGNDGVHTAITWVRLPRELWVREFNGATSKVDCGSPPSLQLLDKVSVELWLYAETIVALDTVAVAGKSTGVGVNGYALTIYDGGMRFYILNRRAIDPTPLVLLTWHHVVGTFDNALVGSEIKLYIDGAEVDTDDIAIPTTDAGTFRLGDIAGGYNFFDGFQALARVYSYALSPTAIGKHFEAERRFFGV